MTTANYFLTVTTIDVITVAYYLLLYKVNIKQSYKLLLAMVPFILVITWITGHVADTETTLITLHGIKVLYFATVIFGLALIRQQKQ